MHTSNPYQSNQQQLFMMAAAIFVSVTAAVIVSTVIIMSLMRGEIAGALSAHTQPTPTTAQVATSCAATPADVAEVSTPAGSEGPVTTQYAGVSVPHHMKAPWMGGSSVSHSFNSTNTSTTTTTNNTTNIHSKTIINDSYNDNSKFSHNTSNPVIVKDNTVVVNSNNGNALNSNNTVNTTTNTSLNSHNTTTVASNNTTTVASNNKLENHVLSDNVTVVAPVPVMP